MSAPDWVELAGRIVVCDIGQIPPEQIRELNRAANRGHVVKRRAPFAGRFGAMKTYYAPDDATFDAYQEQQIHKFDTAQAMDDYNRKARV